MFAVLGEALLDMVQTQRGTTYVARPGGGPFNIAVGLRRLGHPTALLARISTRGLGGIVRAHAARNPKAVFRDLVTSNSALVESTVDWYAQDRQGNVWYFGEDTKEYTNGAVSSTRGPGRPGSTGPCPAST